MNTRKYHGLLVAAMSPPVRRMVQGVDPVRETAYIEPATAFPQAQCKRQSARSSGAALVGDSSMVELRTLTPSI